MFSVFFLRAAINVLTFPYFWKDTFKGIKITYKWPWTKVIIMAHTHHHKVTVTMAINGNFPHNIFPWVHEWMILMNRHSLVWGQKSRVLLLLLIFMKIGPFSYFYHKCVSRKYLYGMGLHAWHLQSFT